MGMCHRPPRLIGSQTLWSQLATAPGAFGAGTEGRHWDDNPSYYLDVNHLPQLQMWLGWNHEHYLPVISQMQNHHVECANHWSKLANHLFFNMFDEYFLCFSSTWGHFHRRVPTSQLGCFFNNSSVETPWIIHDPGTLASVLNVDFQGFATQLRWRLDVFPTRIYKEYVWKCMEYNR